MIDKKIYLGDGAYAKYTGNEVILTTEDGISTTNEIYLDPGCIGNLHCFFDEIINWNRKNKEIKNG